MIMISIAHVLIALLGVVAGSRIPADDLRI